MYSKLRKITLIATILSVLFSCSDNETTEPGIDNSTDSSWIMQIGTAKDDWFCKMASDEYGNSYIAGTFEDSISFGNNKLEEVRMIMDYLL